MHPAMDRLVKTCFRAVSYYPEYAVLIYFMVSFLTTGISLHFGMSIVSTDPQEGFETRGTQMSKERALLQLLDEKSKTRISTRTKRESGDGSGGLDYNDYGNQPIGISDITSGCEQYYALGRFFPTNLVDLMAKAIFEVDSFDILFTLETLKKLCKLDGFIRDVNGRFGKKTELPFTFNLPHYTLCMNSSYTKNCEDLRQPDIDKFKKQVIECENNDDKTSICQSNLGLQLRNYILEKDISIHKSPIYIAAILNIPISSGYDLEYYSHIYSTLSEEYKGGAVTLKGLELNIKTQFFQRDLLFDCILATIAVIVVFLGVLLHTWNAILTVTSFVGMVLSIGIGFCVYFLIFQINFFPFLNLLVFVISIVIGVDDLFLLLTHYRHYKRFFDKKEAMFCALEHCGKGMFVTSVTTAAAFISNVQSDILILRCFGIFASLTIMTNYLFAVTGLPALILLTDRKNCASYKLLSLFYRLLPFKKIKLFFIYRFPQFVFDVKNQIVMVGVLSFVMSILITLHYPGVQLPQNNPMQLLRPHHPFEWYSEHSNSMFNFTYQGNRKMNMYFVWGLEPAIDVPLMDPRKFGDLRIDKTFKIQTSNDVQSFKQTLKYLKTKLHQPKNSFDLPLWIEEFKDFVDEQKEPFHFEEFIKKFVNYIPTFKFPDDFTMTVKDGPLFDMDDNFIGYFLIIPTYHDLGFDYKNINQFMITLDQVKTALQNSNHSYNQPVISPISFVSKMADLMDIMLPNTLISVLISVLISMIVIFLTTWDFDLSILSIMTITITVMQIIAIIILLGWKINVVEAVIIVITIGLSFDYTLHLAVCFKSTPKYLCLLERVVKSMETIFSPICLSALTSAMAGLVLFWSRTQPFFEIGVFMFTMASISFLGAISFFVALIFCWPFYTKRSV
ncbi:unnamed protein product [Bursaphelenchus xylophilus]|uniref:(pine wood nematode) hypothetical protein n=1 Tax=Bursaphelenchus xylophilus TaxID=6326 RepID=A0A1I7RS05_BURXY|nr:unnamed protein product [Bursaphelenchus xylophilus]CAG9123343.1 unnamed protein product [Bursaphelenchus xylophilus]